MRWSGESAALRSASPLCDVERAAHRLDHAAEFDDRSVAGSLDHPPAVRGDGRVEEFGAERAQARQRRFLVRSRQPAEADDVGDEDRRDFPPLAQRSPSPIRS